MKQRYEICLTHVPGNSQKLVPVQPQSPCGPTARIASAIKRSHAYFQLVEAYPLTASGKVQKFCLHEQAIELLGSDK